MKQIAPITTVTTQHSRLVLVCRKCTRKLDGGFGEGQADTLERALKRALRDTGQRREVRLIRAPCFGLCPKRAVTLASSERPEELLVVPAGTDIATLLDRLTPGERSRTPAPAPSEIR